MKLIIHSQASTAPEVWKWISSFIPHFIMDITSYPCWDIEIYHHAWVGLPLLCVQRGAERPHKCVVVCPATAPDTKSGQFPFYHDPLGGNNQTM